MYTYMYTQERSQAMLYEIEAGVICAPFHPGKGTLLIFFLASFSGLVIGFYLMNKGDELIAKVSNGRTDLSPNIGYSMAYLGYAVSIITPFSACVWLVWRIVTCHGSYL
jgi:hypothetical protein